MKKSDIMKALGASMTLPARTAGFESHGDVAMLAYECEQLSVELERQSHGLEGESSAMESLLEEHEQLDGLVAAMEHLSDEPSSKGARIVRVLLRERMAAFGVELPSMEDASDEQTQHKGDTEKAKTMLARFIEAAKAFLAKIVHHLRMIFDVRYRRHQKLEAAIKHAVDNLADELEKSAKAREPMFKATHTQTRFPYQFTRMNGTILKAFGGRPEAPRAEAFKDGHVLQVGVALLKEFTTAMQSPSPESLAALKGKIEHFVATPFGGAWTQSDRVRKLAAHGTDLVTLTIRTDGTNMFGDFSGQTFEQHASAADATMLTLEEPQIRQVLQSGARALEDTGALMKAYGDANLEKAIEDWKKAIEHIVPHDPKWDNPSHMPQHLRDAIRQGNLLIHYIQKVTQFQFTILGQIGEYYTTFLFRSHGHGVDTSTD